jgi:hypothetical protein
MMHIPPKLLLDEHVWQGLVGAFADTPYEVRHLSQTGRRGISDEEVLSFASSQGWAVITYNTKHFVPLARRWYAEGREHPGIILSPEISPGELVGYVRNLLETLPAQELHNTVRWLQEFTGEEEYDPAFNR